VEVRRFAKAPIATATAAPRHHQRWDRTGAEVGSALSACQHLFGLPDSTFLSLSS
jgi:hypothetical protein